MKHIVLMPNTDKDKDYRVTRDAVKVLREAGMVLYAESRHTALSSEGVLLYTADTIPRDAEAVIVFGGDGSILDAADFALGRNIPLLGVNLGRLGYLADLEVSNLSALSALARDGYEERELHLLSVNIGEEPFYRYAVNEVTVFRGSLSHIADMDMCAGNETLRYRADGLIIATPTGSTAYSLSAGGPVIDSSLPLVAVTPICPHSFFARSLVFSSSTEITVKNVNAKGEPLTVSVDGRENHELLLNEIVTVREASCRLRVLSLEKRQFLSVFKEKLSF